MKIKIVQAQVRRAPGGDYKLAVAALLAMYGQSKKGTIYRWVNAAKNLSADVLAFMKHRKDIQQGFVMDNKYLCGHGEDARFKLTDEFAKHALTLLFDKLDGGASITVDTFITEYCQPMKQAELWLKSQHRAFGAIADSSLPSNDLPACWSRSVGESKCLLARAPKYLFPDPEASMIAIKW